MKICFLDRTEFRYDSSSLHSYKLRGAESILINLSKALSVIGNDITIINNCPNPSIKNNIRWININSKFNIENFDLVISNGDCNLFNLVKSKKKILFSHSIQSIEKFIRKKQLISYLKHKPKICFLSNYHKKNRSKLLYLFGSINLKWSVDEIFLESKILDKIDNNLAIFTSRPDRNLKLLIDIWNNYIYPRNKSLKLSITENTFKHNSNSIFERKFTNQKNLLTDLSNSRIFLIPGHKAELFCLAAEEARELCLPIVTLGIGSLSERVLHEKTGFIAKNLKEFSDYTINLFEDDDLWNKMRSNLIKNRGIRNWNDVAKDLLSQI